MNTFPFVAELAEIEFPPSIACQDVPSSVPLFTCISGAPTKVKQGSVVGTATGVAGRLAEAQSAALGSLVGMEAAGQAAQGKAHHGLEPGQQNAEDASDHTIGVVRSGQSLVDTNDTGAVVSFKVKPVDCGVEAKVRRPTSLERCSTMRGLGMPTTQPTCDVHVAGEEVGQVPAQSLFNKVSFSDRVYGYNCDECISEDKVVGVVAYGFPEKVIGINPKENVPLSVEHVCPRERVNFPLTLNFQSHFMQGKAFRTKKGEALSWDQKQPSH